MTRDLEICRAPSAAPRAMQWASLGLGEELFSKGFPYVLPAISLDEPRGLRRRNLISMLTWVFSFPSSPCPAISYANWLYSGKAKAVLLYFHPQGSEFPCMTSKVVRDSQRHLLSKLVRVEAEGTMLSWSSVLLRLLGLSSPWGCSALGLVSSLGKKRNYSPFLSFISFCFCTW